MKPIDIKHILNDILNEVTSHPGLYVYNLQKNFSCIHKLPFYTVIKMLIGMGGNSL